MNYLVTINNTDYPLITNNLCEAIFEAKRLSAEKQQKPCLTELDSFEEENEFFEVNLNNFHCSELLLTAKAEEDIMDISPVLFSIFSNNRKAYLEVHFEREEGIPVLTDVFYVQTPFQKYGLMDVFCEEEKEAVCSLIKKELILEHTRFMEYEA